MADSREHSSFDDEAFLREVRACMQKCPSGDKTTLVLLGDIFELLKTTAWFDTTRRPWHPHSEEVASITCSILDKIARQYSYFFCEIHKLCRSGELDLVYVPGNHDALLAGGRNGSARGRLRDLLGLKGGEAHFESSFQDAAHGVYAEHGHEFDDFNRPDLQQPLFVGGDVVVIELVARLPVETAKCLREAGQLNGQSSRDAMRFLYEMDNVLPQDGEGLLSWLQFSLARVPPAFRDALLAAVLKALRRCVDIAVSETAQFGQISPLTAALVKSANTFIHSRSLTVLKAAACLQSENLSEVSRVTASALLMGSSQARNAQDTFLYIAGHTHFPLHHPIAIGNGRTMTYLNSGTWRRVYLQVPQADGSATFSTYNEETILCVHRRIGEDPPAYEFRRQVRGF